MIDVSEIAEIPASAEEVWEYIGDFNGLPRFIPAVTSSRLEGHGIGAVRHIQVAGTEGETVETLEAQDDAARRLSYSVQVSSLRMHDYYATIEVEELSPDRCRVSCGANFARLTVMTVLKLRLSSKRPMLAQCHA